MASLRPVYMAVVRVGHVTVLAARPVELKISSNLVNQFTEIVDWLLVDIRLAISRGRLAPLSAYALILKTLNALTKEKIVHEIQHPENRLTLNIVALHALPPIIRCKFTGRLRKKCEKDVA